MNILNHIKTTPGSNLVIFNNPNSTNLWEKPKGCKMILFLTMGPGAGGGAGTYGSAGTNRGGGGGGGSGSWTSVLLPSWVVPDKLYISIEGGALGGVNAIGNGVSTGNMVRFDGIPTVGYELFASGSNPAANGGNLGTSGTVTGGAGHGAFTANCYTLLGASYSIAGATGASAVASTGGNSIAAPTMRNNTPGAGGGGINSTETTTNGGNITGYFTSGYKVIPQINGGNASVNAAQHGIFGLMKYISLGGAGGSGITGTGGNGGNGGYGCGGGGGGGGTGAAASAGRGGKGGDGYVEIICW